MSIRYLLDTHALVWAVLEPSRLGAKARRVLDTAAPRSLGISAMSIIELGRLIHTEAIELNGRPADVFGPALTNLVQIPVSLDAALAAPALKLPHGDPADRLIVATARDLRVPLISKDANIADSGLVPVLW